MKFRAIMGALCAAGLMCGVSAGAGCRSRVEVLRTGGRRAANRRPIGVLKERHDASRATPGRTLRLRVARAPAAMTALKTQVISGNAPTRGADQGPADPGLGGARRARCRSTPSRATGRRTCRRRSTRSSTRTATMSRRRSRCIA